MRVEYRITIGLDDNIGQNTIGAGVPIRIFAGIVDELPENAALYLGPVMGS